MGKQLVWVDKVYFRGWACSGCLWRSEGYRWNHGESSFPGIRSEFEAHNCAQHQRTTFVASTAAEPLLRSK
jgi:hypothetical protein